MASESETRGVVRTSRRAPPERIDALLAAGMPTEEVAELLGLNHAYVLERAKMVRLDATGQSTDVTTPQFARDAGHLAAVWSEGGFPSIDPATRTLVNGRGFAWSRPGYNAAA